MPRSPIINENMSVEDVVTQFPATARVFIGHHMNCVGCEVARFETLAEACRIYGESLDQLLFELCEAAGVHTEKKSRSRKRRRGAGE